MKKILLYVLTIVVALFCSLYPTDKVVAVTNKTSYPVEDSTEEIYQDIIVGLLCPKIDEAVDNYYKKYFKDSPTTAPFYGVKILNVDAEKTDPRLSYPSSFEVKVQVMPYFGPHIAVGTDNITFKIGVTGKVQVEKFEHIKSNKLPWNYQNEIINKWPPE